MSLQKFVAGAMLLALLTSIAPAPISANGAASTRNILLLGGAAATYLIIQHNRQVHAREADMARQQAAAQSNANDAWAAYSSEKHAYDSQASEVKDLNREVSYQHSIIVQQQKLLASAGLHTTYVAQNTHSARVVAARPAASQHVAVTTEGWGWGTI